MKMKKNKNKLVENNKKGITLIALIITIVVLLILAGVTISVVFSENGIIKQVGEVEEPWKIGALRDRIENIKMGWITDKLLDKTTTIDDFWNKLKDDKIINDPKKDVEKIAEGKYELDTTEGYIVEAIVDEDGNITIGDIVREDKLPPRINKIDVSNTTNSATITVEVSRLGNGKITYLYKLDGEENYTTFKETTETVVTIPGLIAGKIYNIKVIATNENGSKEADKDILTGTLASGTIRQVGETTWSNGLAAIELETTETGYTLQYQINSIAEGTWKKYTGPISGLSHGDTVFARIYDGVNGSEETTITIQDKVAPTVTVTSGSSTTNSVTVAVTASDKEAGMPASPTYTFYIKKQNEQDSSYTQIQGGASTTATKTGLEQNTTYTIKVEVTDKAGNIGTVTQNITTKGIEGANDGLQTGAIIASTPTWNNGTASITLSTTTGLTIQWQKGGITEGNWTTGSSVTGINHNETIFARLTDGNNYGDEASVTVLDGNNPQTATISLGATSANTGVNVTATVTHNDNESGPNIASCKWVYNTTSGTIGTNSSSYTGTFSSNGETINLNASTPGSYYLHVLTVDNAGNATETIKGPITVKQLVTEISLSPTSATIETEKTQTLTVTVTPDNASNKSVTWTSNNTGVATVSNGVVTGVAPGTANITATAADGSGKSATCSITVKNPVVVGGEFSTSKGVNTPRYDSSKMTPIKWNGSTWVDTTGNDNEWYDYSNKKWANARTADGSMWVWIPRYSYQITTNYHNGGSGVSGNINIKFMKGTTKEAADGTKTWDNVSGQGKWNIHPAFTYGSTVPGIWVAKFEASHSDASASNTGSSSTLKIQPGVRSWRGILISNMYSTCLSYNTTLNSHLIKNSEWGACAYLAQSTYGKNSEVWINPNGNYITGQAGTGPSVGATTSTYSYDNTTYGVQASTTGNITGIYDMNGGILEYVAAYVNNGNSNLSGNGRNLVNGETKTKDVYSKGTSDSQSDNYSAAASIYGDAIYETSLPSSSLQNSWYGDVSSFFYKDNTFLMRGGLALDSTYAGLFNFSANNGGGDNNVGFRPALVIL